MISTGSSSGRPFDSLLVFRVIALFISRFTIGTTERMRAVKHQQATDHHIGLLPACDTLKSLCRCCNYCSVQFSNGHYRLIIHSLLCSSVPQCHHHHHRHQQQQQQQRFESNVHGVVLPISHTGAHHVDIYKFARFFDDKQKVGAHLHCRLSTENLGDA